MRSEEESTDQTPPTCDLLSLLLKNRRPTGAVNEVWPNLFVGDAATAQDKTLIKNLEITHVVNAADGPRHIDTGPHFYEDTNIQYRGIEAPDCRDFDLSPFFMETADFIHEALRQKGNTRVKRRLSYQSADIPALRPSRADQNLYTSQTDIFDPGGGLPSLGGVQLLPMVITG
ncbi:dual specificity phosphatase DUPD1 isoform X2 [Kryptolebias marmoratus]|uniref:Dual specificity protein phosphatase n=1 Tax=Kryptolebias marmoratus TaxID=37003 RepID=A0A3Q3BBP3_KRYMA|nr:dual specificity phosphatase DUPD1 isoform X2 [Kryptolebias marmoratus]